MTNQPRKPKGRASPFGPKHHPPKSFTLTKLAKDIVGRAARRAKTSESNVVDLLVRRHGGEVQATDFAIPASE